jgi:hypothetical protein
MAYRLNGWLEETIQSQLLLGNQWLQDKHEQKKSGVKSEFNRLWKGLYHDNGSCLDIINDIHPEHDSSPGALLLVQARDTQHHSPSSI